MHIYRGREHEITLDATHDKDVKLTRKERERNIPERGKILYEEKRLYVSLL
jgi:hypothetical protein